MRVAAVRGDDDTVGSKPKLGCDAGRRPPLPPTTSRRPNSAPSKPRLSPRAMITRGRFFVSSASRATSATSTTFSRRSQPHGARFVEFSTGQCDRPADEEKSDSCNDLHRSPCRRCRRRNWRRVQGATSVGTVSGVCSDKPSAGKRQLLQHLSGRRDLRAQ